MTGPSTTGALRVFEHHLTVYRRTWKGSVFMSFVSPVLFLAAMGLGLGSLISRGPVRAVDGVAYLVFIAPGLLAASAMQSAYVETTYPIMARIQWERTYEGMLATPIAVLDVLAGEFGWLAFRLALGSGAFFLVMLLFGTIHTALGLLAIVAAVLTGLAFAAPILAWTATRRTDQSFALIGRFLITPLFLLGGVFFPLHQLPQLVQGIAWLTPLAHGVALARGLSLGVLAPSAGIHLAVLLLYAGIGIVAARITLQRRLVQ
jgi:lipooligosaccharide transport system permease protein